MDPFAGIKTLDDMQLTEELDLEQGLAEPFDDVPDFDHETDPEVDVNATLSQTYLMKRTPGRRLFIDYRADPEALTHLKTLPREGQTLHAVICGRYALFDLIPALIERLESRILDLHIATLSYGKKNAADLLGLIDAGQVRRCSLIVSYYFKAQNRTLYDALVPPLRERGHRVLAIRNHAKLLLARTRRGSYVVEGSANLRSCKNIEQFCMSRDRRLYRFHRDWMEAELFAGREEGEPHGAA